MLREHAGTLQVLVNLRNQISSIPISRQRNVSVTAKLPKLISFLCSSKSWDMVQGVQAQNTLFYQTPSPQHSAA